MTKNVRMKNGRAVRSVPMPERRVFDTPVDEVVDATATAFPTLPPRVVHKVNDVTPVEDDNASD